MANLFSSLSNLFGGRLGAISQHDTPPPDTTATDRNHFERHDGLNRGLKLYPPGEIQQTHNLLQNLAAESRHMGPRDAIALAEKSLDGLPPIAKQLHLAEARYWQDRSEQQSRNPSFTEDARSDATKETAYWKGVNEVLITQIKRDGETPSRFKNGEEIDSAADAALQTNASPLLGSSDLIAVRLSEHQLNLLLQADNSSITAQQLRLSEPTQIEFGNDISGTDHAAVGFDHEGQGFFAVISAAQKNLFDDQLTTLIERDASVQQAGLPPVAERIRVPDRQHERD